MLGRIGHLGRLGRLGLSLSAATSLPFAVAATAGSAATMTVTNIGGGEFDLLKTGGVDWAVSANSTTPLTGDFLLRFTQLQVGDGMLGVSLAPNTSDHYNTIDHCIYLNGTSAQPYNLGVSGTGFAYTPTQYAFMKRVGSTLTSYLGGTDGTGATNTQPLDSKTEAGTVYFDSSFATGTTNHFRVVRLLRFERRPSGRSCGEPGSPAVVRGSGPGERDQAAPADPAYRELGDCYDRGELRRCPDSQRGVHLQGSRSDHRHGHVSCGRHNRDGELQRFKCGERCHIRGLPAEPSGCVLGPCIGHSRADCELGQFRALTNTKVLSRKSSRAVTICRPTPSSGR
jgi:hypothetical protein